jgi:uncharacterized membrane protein YgaE (UPF0421/DUF939 family)
VRSPPSYEPYVRQYLTKTITYVHKSTEIQDLEKQLPSLEIDEEHEPYDISQIDFERLRKEFKRSPAKEATVQNLKQVIDKRLLHLRERNPLRTDFSAPSSVKKASSVSFFRI